MTDRRLTPANGRVAARHLQGQVVAQSYVEGEPMQIAVPLAALLRAPGGARDREVLLGHRVQVYEDRDGWSFVQSLADNYVGYLRSAALWHPIAPPTHRVSMRATHAYTAPDIKSDDKAVLSMGATVSVEHAEGRFAKTDVGFIPTSHLTPLAQVEDDPVRVAERLLGTPYLWGGNSFRGIDCSGLVQIALHMCGQSCPGDSDMQEAALGETLPQGTTPRRGDLLFWKGHVAWVVDADTILHSNAGAMSTVHEPLNDAITRIMAQGDGPVTRHARLTRA